MTRRGLQRHQEIAEYLRELIASGQLRPGDHLPSEAELCEKFDYSRGPVRQAVSALRAEGLVSSGRGRRSVVLGTSFNESFDAIYSLTVWMQEHGFEPSQKTLWLARRPAPARAAKALRLAEGDQLVFLHRIRTSNGTSPIIEKLYFPLEVGRQILNFDADSGSVHSHLQAAGVDFDSVHREVSIAIAEEDAAEIIGVEPGAPLWDLRIEVSDHSGTPVEYAEYLFRSDRLRFGLTNVRGGRSPFEFIPMGVKQE